MFWGGGEGVHFQKVENLAMAELFDLIEGASNYVLCVFSCWFMFSSS